MANSRRPIPPRPLTVNPDLTVLNTDTGFSVPLRGSCDPTVKLAPILLLPKPHLTELL
jgi:hypothetical protein